MHAARFARLSPLLDRLLDVEGTEARRRLLEVLAGGDAELRCDLALLLARDEEAGGLLDEPSAERALDPTLAGATGAGDGQDNLGERVGVYRLLSELGRGGMGTVYLAERADGQFTQKVALKLMRRGLDSEDVLARFLAERQILAGLQHPAIARLLDGGVSADGRPFFALEHVPGVPLSRYCGERELAIDARLALFESVCRAVEYAHRNLVVHRDLKPTNILVSEEGEVKLLDFGIAKVLAGGAEELALTAAGPRPMTPDYAAPEQVRGEAVTTATDVYGLGLVLYELLADRRPFTGRASRSALERAVLEEVPAPPSSVAPRSIPRELDGIVARALAKEPERRYESVAALRADIERFRAGLPVAAHPDGLGYRAGKFLRRHKLGVAAAAFSLLSLLAGLGGTLWQARRAAEEAAKQRAAKDFLASLFQVSDPDERRGKASFTAVELLDRGVERVDGELAAQPELQAELLAVIGDLYAKLGEYGRARRTLRASLARLRERGIEDGRVGGILLTLAAVERDAGRPAEAEESLRRAIEIDSRELGDEALETARDRAALAQLLADRRATDEASALFERALARFAHAPGRLSGVYADTLNAKAQMLHGLDDVTAARALYEEVLAIRRQLYGERHSKTAESLGNLAAALRHEGNHARAAEILRQVVAIDHELYGDRHPVLAIHLSNLGSVLLSMGQAEEAERLHRQALEMRRQFLGEDNPELASGYQNLGKSLAQLGRLEEAEPLLRTGLALTERAFGRDHPLYPGVVCSLARLLRARGKSDEATSLTREVACAPTP